MFGLFVISGITPIFGLFVISGITPIFGLFDVYGMAAVFGLLAVMGIVPAFGLLAISGMAPVLGMFIMVGIDVSLRAIFGLFAISGRMPELFGIYGAVPLFGAVSAYGIAPEFCIGRLDVWLFIMPFAGFTGIAAVPIGAVAAAFFWTPATVPVLPGRTGPTGLAPRTLSGCIYLSSKCFPPKQCTRGRIFSRGII
jgi:hypothetical protein